MIYREDSKLKVKLDLIKLHFRRAKNKSYYVKADDVSKTGRAIMLIKQAVKTPNNVIVVPSANHQQFIEDMCKSILRPRQYKNMPRIISIYWLTRYDFKHTKKIFIEEFMDRVDLFKLNSYIRNFEHKVKLSYTPLN